ncbi:hypothetical protein GCM10009854_27200 [Saccharopolyspora halophila]|uniref:Uncharacterized protein n=1 Tax=Saccharopolyspora halophila TaxID=405551 RepID=A0ABN3GCQ7_9PSEU
MVGGAACVSGGFRGWQCGLRRRRSKACDVGGIAAASNLFAPVEGVQNTTRQDWKINDLAFVALTSEFADLKIICVRNCADEAQFGY